MINHCYLGDCIEVMNKLVKDGQKVQTIITSPPYYGLRDYGMDGQIGLEETPKQYIEKMVEVFTAAWDLLSDDGTLWLNIGDSYAGSSGCSPGGSDKQKSNTGAINSNLPIKKAPGIKTKDLIGIPWMLAFALRDAGWYLRQDIIWAKPNPMPESVNDRCTKSHEYLFLLTKSSKYYFDNESIQEFATGFDGRKDTTKKPTPKYMDGAYLGNGNAQSLSTSTKERWKYKNLGDKGQSTHSMHEKRLTEGDDLSPIRNKRSVWTIPTQSCTDAHFAVMPEALVEPCILAGSKIGDVVFDPFMGSGTVARVAQNLGRKWLGAELNPAYIDIQKNRTAQLGMEFA
jgi:DNA modification methylase